MEEEEPPLRMEPLLLLDVKMMKYLVIIIISVKQTIFNHHTILVV